MKKSFLKLSTLFISLLFFASCGTSAALPGELTSEDNVKGNIQSSIVITEYSDFQCPACGSYYNLFKEAWPEIQNDVLFVYRHFPLQTIHPYAITAATYAQAAGEQGRFWEMHDLIFEGQEEWSNPNAKIILDGYAENLGLDMKKFKEDLSSSNVMKKIRNDIASANAQRINSTPTFYINGEKIQNPRNVDELKGLVKAVRGK